MKKFSVTTLENQVEKLRSLVERRQDYHSDRSEKWQESEAGEEFEDKTSELETLLDDLESAVQAIEDWNND